MEVIVVENADNVTSGFARTPQSSRGRAGASGGWDRVCAKVQSRLLNATFTLYGDGASNHGQVFEALHMVSGVFVELCNADHSKAPCR